MFFLPGNIVSGIGPTSNFGLRNHFQTAFSRFMKGFYRRELFPLSVWNVINLMGAASESSEIQKGLNQLCMSIISIDQNMYSQGRNKQRCKLSTEHIGLLKILRNEVEITTPISKWTCQSRVLSRNFWRWYQWAR